MRVPKINRDIIILSFLYPEGVDLFWRKVNDPVKIQYARTTSGETVVYEKVFDSLDALYAASLSGDIVLE